MAKPATCANLAAEARKNAEKRQKTPAISAYQRRLAVKIPRAIKMTLKSPYATGMAPRASDVTAGQRGLSRRIRLPAPEATANTLPPRNHTAALNTLPMPSSPLRFRPASAVTKATTAPAQNRISEIPPRIAARLPVEDSSVPTVSFTMQLSNPFEQQQNGASWSPPSAVKLAQAVG